jgi:hypothetical protein
MDNTEYIRRYTDRFVDRRKAQQANEVIDYLANAVREAFAVPDPDTDLEYPADCVCGHGYDEHDIGNDLQQPCYHLTGLNLRCACMLWTAPPVESPISKP